MIYYPDLLSSILMYWLPLADSTVEEWIRERSPLLVYSSRSSNWHQQTGVRLIAVSWRHGNKLYVKICALHVYNLSLSKCYDNSCARTLRHLIIERYMIS